MKIKWKEEADFLGLWDHFMALSLNRYP